MPLGGNKPRRSLGQEASEPTSKRKSSNMAKLSAVKGTVAHLRCVQIRTIEADGDHFLIMAQITQAFVREDYWDGKCFAPTHPSARPFLTFFGSQRFGYVFAEREPFAQRLIPNGQAENEDATAEQAAGGGEAEYEPSWSLGDGAWSESFNISKIFSM